MSTETMPRFLRHADPDYGFRLIYMAENIYSGSQMRRFGQDFVSRTAEVFGDQPLDIIGIPHKGELLANVGHGYRIAEGYKGELLTYRPTAELIPPRRAGIDGVPSGADILVFDNSIRSGQSLERLSSVLSRHDLHPEHVLRLVDYEDEREDQVAAVARACGMTALSLYTMNDVEIVEADEL